MSRVTVINIVIGVLAASLVGVLIWQETSDWSPSPTTTSTTTTMPPTTTTTTTTTTTSTTTTSTSTTTTTSPPPPSTEVLIERFFVPVVVVNGTNTGELLAPTVERTRSIGYFSVRGLNSQARLPTTVIYAFDAEHRGEAEVLALDLGFELTADPPDDVMADDVGVRVAVIELFEDAPLVSGLADAKVMVFLGADGLPDSPPAPDESESGEGGVG